MKEIQKNGEMFGQNISNTKKKGFTLVELIIVITILAILATIAFVSFQGYMKGARDSNRVTTITQIHKGIGTFQTTTGNVPNIDNQIGTGTLSGNPVTYVGYIGDTVSKLIKLSKTPIDPATNTNYIYGVDITKTKYQVATIAEDLQTNKGNLITQTYADGGLKARVLGNYQGLLKYNGKIYNIPSLIITFSGATSQDLLATNTNYVIDKTDNLPYLTSQAKQLNTLTPTQVLQKLANTGATLIVTGITLPTDASTWNSSSGTLQTAFGYKIDLIGQTIFGDKYFTEIKGSTVTGGGGGGGGGSTTCSAGQGYNGTACITATQCTTGLQNITLSNGQIWSCMNLGATTVRDGSTQPTNCGNTSTTNCNSALTWLGDYYQWGRNEPVNTTVTGATYNGAFTGTLGHNNFIVGELANGDWWQNEAGNTTPTRWTGTTPQGPCPTNWHVPTQAEWQTLCNLVTGTTCTNGMAYNSAISQTLKLPFAGSRSWSTGNYSNQSVSAYYWSSSPFSSNAYYLVFNASIIAPANLHNRASAFSLRCIKN